MARILCCLLIVCFFSLHLAEAQTVVRGVNVQQEQDTATTFSYTEKYALLIGIDNYDPIKTGFSPLRYASNDALSIQHLLTGKLGFSKKNVKVLLNRNATRRNILNALESFTKENITENSQLIVYFAGHGVTTGNSSNRKRGFLIPFDGSEEELNATALAMDEIRQQSDFLRPRHVLFLIDACYGGLAQSRGETFNTMAYIKNIWSQRSREIITAGSADETVIESSDWQHSSFTKVLLGGLDNEEADTNSDNIIVTSELFGYIQQRVPYYAQQKGGKQTPQLSSFTPETGTSLFELRPNAIARNKGNDFIPETNKINQKFYSKLAINTNVDNPRIVVNGTDYGFLNSKKGEFSLAPGYYKIEIEKDKYDLFSKEIDLKPDSSATLNATLIQKIFGIEISVKPDDALIWANNRLLGKNSQVVELEKGRHLISAQKAGFLTKNIFLDVLENSSLAIEMEQIKGIIEINSSVEKVKVSEGGKVIGYTPVTFDLDFGPHEIRFEKENFLPQRYQIDIKEPIKVVQNVALKIDPAGSLARRASIDFWNRKIVSNFSLASVGLLGYFYFDKQIKDNFNTTTFLTRSVDIRKRNLWASGKIACLSFFALESVSGFVNFNHLWKRHLKKDKSLSLTFDPSGSNSIVKISLNL